jgi:hypothetical protein
VSTDPRHAHPLHWLIKPLEWALALAVLVQDGLSWLLAPLLRWIASLRLMALFTGWVARLPAYAVLAVLAVPLATAWPLKLIGLLLVASGRVIAGGVVLILAYGMSLVLVERIFAAGKPQLLTIRWFAAGYRWFAALHERVIAWVKGTAIWRAMRDLVARLRPRIGAMIARVRVTIRSWFPRRP